jgi:hypothetical protein
MIPKIPDDCAKTNNLSLFLGFERIRLIAIKAIDNTTNKATNGAHDLKHWP